MDFKEIVRKKHGGSVVQTLLFSKKHYTIDEAKKWLKSHGFHYGKVDEAKSFYRFRQRDPEEFDKSTFATICFLHSDDGKCKLYAVIGKLKGERSMDLEEGEIVLDEDVLDEVVPDEDIISLSEDDAVSDDEILDFLFEQGAEIVEVEGENDVYTLEFPTDGEYTVQEVKSSDKTEYVLNIYGEDVDEIFRYVFPFNPLERSGLGGKVDETMRDISMVDYEGLLPRGHSLNPTDDDLYLKIIDSGEARISAQGDTITFSVGGLEGVVATFDEDGEILLSIDVDDFTGGDEENA